MMHAAQQEERVGVGNPPPELIRLHDVSKTYMVKQNNGLRAQKIPLNAVDDVTLGVGQGHTVGVVGESGSGKSTLGRLAIRLLDSTAGSITFGGENITHLKGSRLRRLRRRTGVIFQDPLGSLDPRMSVQDIVGEPLRLIEGVKGSTLKDRVGELLQDVGLDPSRGAQSPKSLSGGQRQRVAIARGVSLNPEFVLADEPVSALDVSVQAQISNLMIDLQEKYNLTYLFIGHGLPIVRQLSQRIAVMYMGRVVEIGDSEAIFSNPQHPYTRALISASAGLENRGQERERIVIKGEPPSPLALPTGCRFRTRCPIAQPICAEIEPPRLDPEAASSAECHFPLGKS